MLSYAFRVAMQLINNLAYREDLLRCLVELYRGLAKPELDDKSSAPLVKV